MPSLETAGYRRFWPMRQHEGREVRADGSRVEHATEVFRDMVSGEVYAPVDGWNGGPPDAPSGSKEKEGRGRTDTDAYRRNYECIDWDNAGR